MISLKINEFIIKNADDERIDVYYQKRTKEVNEILGLLKKTNHKLIGKLENTEVIFLLHDVYYFESVDKKTYAYLKDKVLRIEDILSEIEKTFFESGFIRVNKSTVLNIYKVQTLMSALNMKEIALLDNGEKIQVNRSYKSKFKGFLKTMSEGGFHDEINQ